MADDICRYYREKAGVSLKVVSAPCLYSARYSKDWLYQTFQSLEKGKMSEFPKQNEDMADFLYLDDLGELIFRIFDNWDQDDRSLEIVSCAKSRPFRKTGKNCEDCTGQQEYD